MSSRGSSETDGPSARFRRQFWLLVGVLNLALLATALGAFVLLFWARPTLGVGLLAVGVGAGVFGWQRYRRVRADLSDAE